MITSVNETDELKELLKRSRALLDELYSISGREEALKNCKTLAPLEELVTDYEEAIEMRKALLIALVEKNSNVI